MEKDMKNLNQIYMGGGQIPKLLNKKKSNNRIVFPHRYSEFLEKKYLPSGLPVYSTQPYQRDHLATSQAEWKQLSS
jgi:hypothetical protein